MAHSLHGLAGLKVIDISNDSFFYFMRKKFKFLTIDYCIKGNISLQSTNNDRHPNKEEL